MKSTWFSDRARYDFARCLQDSDHSRHSWDLFGSWLQVAAGSLKQACHVLQTGSKCDELESQVVRYQQQIKKPEKLAEAFSILAVSLETKRDDFLGSVLMEWGINDVAFKGQCFTPMCVCEMMARMTLHDREVDPEKRLMISEPACGGGAMVIASSMVLQEKGFFPWNYHWACVDLDWRCFACCYIQATVLGIPARVIHGNTLTLEQFEYADTFAAVMHPVRKTPIRPAQIVPESVSRETIAETALKQMMLF